MRKILASLFVALLLCGAAPGPGAKNVKVEPSWAKEFKDYGVEGTFVLFNPKTGEYRVHNLERAKVRYYPASTFKILNSLIALEIGIATGPDMVLKWDGKDTGRVAINRDLRMREAFRLSAVWYYQELARRIGRDRMQKHVDAVRYGNRRLGATIDRFWLDGPLQVSAFEQVAFLDDVRARRTPFSPKAIDGLREIMISEKRDDRVLRAKTGWTNAITPDLGWYVGWVERGDEAWVFATNIDLRKAEDGDKRVDVTREILAKEGIFPLAGPYPQTGTAVPPPSTR